MDDKCDSVKRSIVTVGTQKRLDIRNYSGGRLRRFESYPYSEKGVPGVMTEIYSEGEADARPATDSRGSAPGCWAA